MLRTFKLPVGELGSNCFLAWEEDTGEGVVIDPGAEGARIIEAARKREIRVRYVLLTHGHADHIGASGELKEAFGAPALIHESDAPMLEDPELNMSIFIGPAIICPPADGFLKPGNKITFGGIGLEVIHVPGHSPGSVCLYDGEEILFSGDALFQGSIGRCDFPGGDQDLLVRCIRERLLSLPEETQVLPGHGQNTTIGQEKKWNPFLS